MTTKGRLLVATPTLLDPNFARTVVLVLEHTSDGALGVVLNRPSETDLVNTLPEWGPLAATPPVVFVGGPVAPGAAIGIAHGEVGDTADGWAPVFGDLGTVDLGRKPDELAVRIDAVRVFAGYAGWTAGQLDAELALDGWFVVDSDAADPFATEPDQMWSAILRRQPGRLAVFADAPLDASVN